MEKLKNAARSVTLFKELTDEELIPLLDIMRRKEYINQEMIFIHDTPITDIYIVESGKVKVSKNDLSGKEQIIRVMQRGDLFPHVGFFRNENYPAHSQAIEDTVLYSVSIKQFEDTPYKSKDFYKVITIIRKFNCRFATKIRGNGIKKYK